MGDVKEPSWGLQRAGRAFTLGLGGWGLCLGRSWGKAGQIGGPGGRVRPQTGPSQERRPQGSGAHAASTHHWLPGKLCCLVALPMSVTSLGSIGGSPPTQAPSWGSCCAGSGPGRVLGRNTVQRRDAITPAPGTRQPSAFLPEGAQALWFHM